MAAESISQKWKYGVDLFPVFGWRGPLAPPVTIIAMAMIIVGIFLPEAWVQQNAAAHAFSSAVREAMMRVTPLADFGVHAKSTTFPAVALLSHALLWAGLPIVVIYSSLINVLNWSTFQSWLEVTHKTRPEPRFHAVGFLVMLTAPIIFSLIPGGSKLAGEPDTTSRLFFTFMSVAVLFFWQAIAYGMPSRFAYSRRRKNEREIESGSLPK